MERNHFSQRRKTYVLSAFALGALLLSSCAQDGFDDSERFNSSVTNSTLTSPASADISITASADASQTIISWPVVEGAGGYLCSVYDVTDADAPVAISNMADSVVDRCRIAVAREVDHNYTFSIKTLGNENLNNTDAPEATVVAFNSFTAAIGTIPDGEDITAYIAQNPLPEEAVSTEMAYDLVPGGHYVMSGNVDFGNKRAQLRSTDQNNPANVEMQADASFITATGLSIKNVNFNASASNEPFILYSETPDPSTLGATGTGDYYNITSSLLVQNCKIDGLNDMFIFDNNVKYCVGTAIINNCVINLTAAEAPNSFIYFQSGFINDLTIQNTTVYDTGANDGDYYFVRYNNSGRSTRAGYASNSITYDHCTFYNVANAGQWGNYGGFNGQKTSIFNMTNNIFVDCGNNQVPRRFVGGNINSATAVFGNNTYMYDGTFESTGGIVANYDNSGTAIEMDPGFADPVNGDFTISGSEQAQRGTGDPRWLPDNQ